MDFDAQIRRKAPDRGVEARGETIAASARRSHPKGRSEAKEARQRLDGGGPTWPRETETRCFGLRRRGASGSYVPFSTPDPFF